MERRARYGYSQDAENRRRALLWRRGCEGIAILLAAFLLVAVYQRITAPHATTVAIDRNAPAIAADDLRVIDGDTISVYRSKPNVRLVGLNAPETYRAECPAELDLGERATRRLKDIVSAGNLSFQYCPPSAVLRQKGRIEEGSVSGSS
jgi:endonuclease YncB( thermonuclease family)